MRKYHKLCSSVAAIALMAFSASARASDAAPNAAQQGAQADPVAPTDIIVTATRRNESLSKVPITIQAFNTATLSQLNITDFSDLIKYTPNVTFGNNGPGAGTIFLRGLSSGLAAVQNSVVAYYPNVALYLDDQSLQLPGRNADIYVADLERIEVLEGPQGTLFGGGAEAGAIRYITNKPKLDAFSGHFEGSAGGTAGGAPNASFNATINIPIVKDKLAVRAVIYDDHHGGYIDNVPGTYTRGSFDHYANYLGTPTAANQSNNGQYNNNDAIKKNYNPVDYIGGRVSVKWQVDNDWDVLVSELYQTLDTQGTFATEPYSPDFAKLGPLQTVTFEPSYSNDRISNTAWTVNGNMGGFHLVYTGSYMARHVEAQQDYTNYSRAFAEYYQCTGSGTGIGSGAPYCYQPNAYWHSQTKNTQLTQEVRLSTPVDKPFRVIAGGFYEKFRMAVTEDFDYKSTPTCTTEIIAAGTGCLGLVQTNPASTSYNPGLQPSNTAFGVDLQRGYDQYAFFGSADLDIFPNLTLTGGTRYYHYSEFQTGSQYQTTAASCSAVLICSTNGVGDINLDANKSHSVYHGFKSRASLTWRPSTATTMFATFSQGFRPGGFNRAAADILPDANGTAQYIRPLNYAPDTLTNWEVGLKTDLADHKVQFNLSAYYMVWDNVQTQFFNPAGGFGNTSYVTNGADFHVKGVEAQISVRPYRGVSVQGGITYNDSKQASSPCLIADAPGSLTQDQCITSSYKTTAASGGTPMPVVGPFGSVGSSLPFSPHVQANLRLRYDWLGPAALKFWVGGGLSYTGSTTSQPSTYPSGTAASVYATPGPNGVLIPSTTLLQYTMPGYALVDVQIGIKRDTWNVSIFGENITNSHASQFTSAAQFIKSEAVVRPATYGIKLTYDF